MHEEFTRRARELAERAGVAGLSPRVAAAAVAIMLLVAAFAVWRWLPSRTETFVARPSAAVAAGPSGVADDAGRAATRSAEPTAPGLWVHVVGAVRHPGLVELAAGARVSDAIGAAGGLLGNASAASVNLARKVTDGEQLVVPTEAEAQRGGGGGAAISATGGAGGTPAAPGTSAGPIDLNSATAEQLDTLPGVGPATALKIVADRETNGPFGSVDDLGRVSGIGPKKLEQLKDLICVR